jgi:hypothetical protein
MKKSVGFEKDWSYEGKCQLGEEHGSKFVAEKWEIFWTIRRLSTSSNSALDHTVAQLVEALRYKPKGPGSILDGVIGIFYIILAALWSIILGL